MKRKRWYTTCHFRTIATATLTVDEFQKVCELSYRRGQLDKARHQRDIARHGREDFKRVDRSRNAEDIDRQGRLGEWAFAKMFPSAIPTQPMDSVKIKRGQHDFTLNGVNLDIKTHELFKKPGLTHMIISPYAFDRCRADYACILRLDSLSFACVGFFRKSWIDIKQHRHKWKPGVWVRFDELVTFWELIYGRERTGDNGPSDA